MTDKAIPEPPRRPRRDRRARWRAQLPRMLYFVDKLVQVEDAIEKTIGGTKFNAAGLASLVKQTLDIREKLDELLDLAPDDLEGASPEEIRQYLSIVMEQWPNDHLEVAFRIYAERHGGRVLFISDGGHKAELDESGEWRSVEG